MTDSRKKWIIKDSEGRIRGPYPTEKILDLISKGHLVGEEKIALYPGQKWEAISRDPTFYDRLLEVIAGQPQPKNPSTYKESEFFEGPVEPEQKSQSQKKQSLSVDEATKPGLETDEKLSETTRPSNQNTKSGSKTKKGKRSGQTESVIELIDVHAGSRKKILKKAKLPLLLVGVAAVFILLSLLIGGEEKGMLQRSHLIAPRLNQAPIPEEQAAQKTRTGVAAYLQDTATGYRKAQNEFVQVAEANPKNAQVLSILCLTYLELWPYSYQDGTDLKTVNQATRWASSAEPSGINAATCRAVELLLRAQYVDARSVIESVIDQFANTDQPPIAFYYLKAMILDGVSDHQTAIGYLKSAQQLWPQWLRVYSYEAHLQAKIGQAAEAARIFQNVLKANPVHVVSRLELGVLEFRHFRHLDQADSRIRSAIQSGEKAPPGVLSEGYLALAEIALQRGRGGEALELAQKSYGMNPGNLASKNLIVRLGGVEKLKQTKVLSGQLVFEGDQLVREGDCNAAQAHFKSAFERDPKNAVAAFKAAECMWQLSFTREAFEWMNNAIRADRKYAAAYAKLADYYTQRYNFQAAAQILAAGQRELPNNYEILRGFALVELRRGSPQGAIAFARKALAAYSTDAETYNLMAEALMSIGNYSDAYPAASKAIEIDPNSRKGQVIYAKALGGIQGVEVGRNYLAGLVQNFPLILDYRVGLAEMYFDEELYDAAIEVFQNVIDIEPKSKSAYLGLGKSLRAQRNFKEASEVFLQAAVLDPADPEPLFQTGLLYLDAGKPAEAIGQFQRVLQVNSSYPRVHYHMGRAALLNNNPRLALQESETEKRANPNLADAYLLAAEAHSKLDQYGLCASEYQKAIRLRPQGASIYVRLAECYRKSGNLDIAISMLNQAAAQESGYAEIYKEQGQVYEMKGDRGRAIEAYNQYFVLDPSAADRQLIENRIQLLLKGP